MKDDLGDRMKMYESMEVGRRFMPLLPVVARIDGRSFHSFTRGMDRPFDHRLSSCLVDTAIYLARETNACMAYTQSDEITLAWYSADSKSQIWFDGRITKMTSLLAAHATLRFYQLICERLPGYSARMPTFDARIWQVPSKAEAANVFLWREWDATKNSVSMAASAFYSHHELHAKNTQDKHEMLFKKGVNWNDYPTWFKRGAYMQKRSVIRPFSTEEIDNLPEKHAAKLNPDLAVTRTEWSALEMPIFSTITNREAVIFDGAEPQLAQLLTD